MASDSVVLRGHLESLPQELYDSIYDLTFSALESAMWPRGQEDVLIHNDYYRFPMIFHIDQRTRLQYTEQYYSKGRFEFNDKHSARKFLDTLGADYRNLLKQDMRLRILGGGSTQAGRMRIVLRGFGRRYDRTVGAIVWLTGPGPIQYLEFRFSSHGSGALE